MNRVNRIYNFLRKLNIRNRIALTLLLSIFISTVIIFQIPKLISQNLIKGYLNDYIKSIQTEIETSVGLMLDDINMMSVGLLINQDIYDLVDDNGLSHNEKQKRLREILDSTLEHKENIGDILVIANNGDTYRYAPDSALIQMPDEDYVNKIKKTTSPVWGQIEKDINNNSYVLLGRPYYNFYTQQNLGYLIVYIREAALQDIYKKVIQNWGYSFIINQDNHVISHPVKEKIGGVTSDPNFLYANKDYNNRVASLDNQQVIIATHKFNQRLESIGVKWEIVSVISYKKLFAIYDTINRSIYIFQIFLFIIAIFVSFKISSKITSPVVRLKEKLYLFGRGNTDAFIPQKTGDEVWELEMCYNDMIVRINDLIQKNNEEKEKQRELELIALQAQINPHFVYNTLDAIGWAAKMRSPSDVEKILMSLAKFFRISLHKGDKFITVSEELELIKSFITIEQMGFENKFEVHFDVSEEIMDCKMLKIVLQPIVENAIKHGISRIKEMGSIEIKGYRIGDDLRFEIVDNGIGFDMNSVNFEKSYNQFQHSGYGLRNVNERIVLEYGKKYGLSFESRVGMGTKVQVLLKIKV